MLDKVQEQVLSVCNVYVRRKFMAQCLLHVQDAKSMFGWQFIEVIPLKVT